MENSLCEKPIETMLQNSKNIVGTERNNRFILSEQLLRFKKQTSLTEFQITKYKSYKCQLVAELVLSTNVQQAKLHIDMRIYPQSAYPYCISFWMCPFLCGTLL